MCTLFVIKDASANEEYQEEELYTEEEEEHFDNLTNQGKLYQMQDRLVQASKDTFAIYLLHFTNPKFFLQSSYFLKYFYN